MCDPLLPQMAGELGVTIGGGAMLVTGFALADGVLRVVVDPLGDAPLRAAPAGAGTLLSGQSISEMRTL